jgi:hypothetical protein
VHIANGAERIFTYPPIAGVQARHHVPSDWEMDPNYIAQWDVGAVLEDPVVVRHVESPIDPDQLEPISGVPAEDNFFRNRDGEVVVGFIPTIWPTTSTHLVTERAGYSYRLHYSARAIPGEPPWIRHRVLYALTFPARDRGFITHALGFRHPAGFGVICPARAGTGKSTLAQLIRAFDAKIPLLSDDRVVVRREALRFAICGTPWRSAARAASPECAPLGAIVFMEHGGRTPSMRRVDPNEALRRILQCVALPYWDDRQMHVALGQLDALVSQVPAIECSYAVDVGSAAWILEVLSGEADGG